MRELLGNEIAGRIKNGDVIGIGTGTTVDAVLAQIKMRILKEKLVISAVPTSIESSWAAGQAGMHVLSPLYRGRIAWAFDGADEIDPRFRLIKGRGGALFKEKVLASRAQQFIIVADESKLVDRLGSKFAVPVEVLPEALGYATEQISSLGAESVDLRLGVKKHGPVITECGNIILDCSFRTIDDQLEGQLKQICGVIESGVFTKQASEVLIATQDGLRMLKRP